MDDNKENRLAEILPHIEVNYGSNFAKPPDVIWYTRRARGTKRRCEEGISPAGPAADTVNRRPIVRANRMIDSSVLLELM